MDSQTPPPRRSRLAPDQGFPAGNFPAQEEAPAVDVRTADGRAAETLGRIEAAPGLPASGQPDDSPQRVIVTDVHMAFWSMVSLLVKLAFALIPAAVIITLHVLVTISVAERLSSLVR